MSQRPGWNYWDASDLIKRGRLDIGDGYRAKNSEMGDEGLPFARAGNINNGFHFEDADFLSKESVEKAKAAGKLSKPGDVTFTSKGTFGRFAYVSERTLQFVYSPQLCYWRVKDHRLIDPRFLYYWMQGSDCMNQLVQIKGLTDMADYVSLTNQRRMWISAPPLPTQYKIAAILSAYDDLIENNLRRINILDEMAQNLYREWFVKFRFTGHEKARFTDSPLGRIPEGWEVVRIKDVADVNARNIKKGEAPAEIAYIDIASVSPGSIDNIEMMTFSDSPSRARRITRHGDVIWSSVRPNRRSFSLIIDPPANLVVSTGFAVISANDVPFTYLYQTVTTDDFVAYLVNHAKGAAYPAVSAEDFENADILIPSNKVLSNFDDHVLPTAVLAHRLKAKNATLRRTRDLLLPKLISGQVDVSELDIAVPEDDA